MRFLLVHGYLGAPDDLAPLAAALAGRFGTEAVESLCLPGHGPCQSPGFDETACLAALATALDRDPGVGDDLVLIGHSTGGNLILAELARRLAEHPASLARIRLLVLCATPPHIDLGYARRWEGHADGGELHDLGGLVSLVNRLARRGPLALPAPVLVLQGEADELVPASDAVQWRAVRFAGPVRLARIPGARHHLFRGEGAEQALDIIVRAVHDRMLPETDTDRLAAMEPALAGLTAAWPDSLKQVALGPAGHRALGSDFQYGTHAATEPTLANIEITTRCNLGCPACARTQLKRQSRHMDLDTYRRVLEGLPHAWRIVLVGLGEPLLHPEVVEFVRIATAEGRRVSLVNNAMALDADLAEALCNAGLAAITFSLDAVSQTGAERVRTGSDMALIAANIRTLLDLRRRRNLDLGVAAFTALSRDNLDEFAAIVDFAADLGLDAVMVSDLNFVANQARTLHRTLTPDQVKGLRLTLRHAAARRLPVLSVHGLEEIALPARHLDYLLLRGEPIGERSQHHRHCASPWQTVPVNVDGRASVCDCQPEAVIGNVADQPLAGWWNGPAMVDQRRRMMSDQPPEACLVCPRF
ncbi:MAG TPA: radical SAM protein [Burkholderiaceae bacterium]|nr:radical SAM protein [Burkholderiaceae bacterium]